MAKMTPVLKNSMQEVLQAVGRRAIPVKTALTLWHSIRQNGDTLTFPNPDVVVLGPEAFDNDVTEHMYYAALLLTPHYQFDPLSDYYVAYVDEYKVLRTYDFNTEQVSVKVLLR